jgi:general L-amino acid transport system permease protein
MNTVIHRKSFIPTQTLLVQIALLLLIVWLIAETISLFVTNTSTRSSVLNFDFLHMSIGAGISESLIPLDATDTVARGILVGGLNTIMIAVLSCIIATVLGLLLCLLRLSSHPLVSVIAIGAINLVRNTPILLQVLFWYALMLKLPRVADALSIGDSIFLSQRGLNIIWFDWQWSWWRGALFLAVVIAPLYLWFKRSSTLWSLRTNLLASYAAHAGAIVLALCFFALIFNISADVPVKRSFNFSGGVSLSPELTALLFGISLYSSAFIAEALRGGINAVSKGQWDAAYALGLPYRHTFKLIVLPQALRASMGSLINEYAGLIKSSSLAIVLGYPDLLWVLNTAIITYGRELEGALLILIGYLVPTFTGAWLLNYYNRHLMRWKN